VTRSVRQIGEETRDRRAPVPGTPPLAALILAALVLSAAPLSGQLAGRVFEVETGQALDAARIVLLGVDGDTVATAASRGDGRFGIHGEPRDGEYLIAASVIGYTPVYTTFEYDGDPLAFEMRLSTAPLQIQGISVQVEQRRRLERSGFYDREEQGLGDYLTFEDPASRQGVNRTSQLVRRIAGVSVSRDGEPYFRGASRCQPVLVVDHMVVRDHLRPSQLNDEFDLHMPHPDDLLGMEIYRTRETTPPQWQRPGMCGAIVVWTR